MRLVILEIKPQMRGLIVLALLKRDATALYTWSPKAPTSMVVTTDLPVDRLQGIAGVGAVVEKPT